MRAQPPRIASLTFVIVVVQLAVILKDVLLFRCSRRIWACSWDTVFRMSFLSIYLSSLSITLFCYEEAI